jgi:tRNA modification GTPase
MGRGAMRLRTSTVFAVSSGSQPSGVAVVRISGPNARFVVETVCGDVPPERMAVLRSIRDRNGDLVDRALVLFFPSPRSFTGEDVAEFHLHGGKAVVRRLLDLLGEFEDCSSAEAGEFTRRAFLNGKLDLTTVEALADLIDAETELQRRVAVANAHGAQKRLYYDWRERLLHIRAFVEADLDFSDEGDVRDLVGETVWRQVEELRREVSQHLARLRSGEIVREGFRVVLAGAPNVGKSSLLNQLAGRDVAIVTPEPGTTRDLVEVALDIGGAKVVVVDTAGLRDDAGLVEAIGIAKARDRQASADLVLLLSDGVEAEPVLEIQSEVWRIATKLDLERTTADADFAISCVTGRGIDDLISAIGLLAVERGNDALVGPTPVRERQAEALRAFELALGDAMAGSVIELRAEALRLASEHLARLTGVIHTEELLGRIFSSFCIGK